MLKNVICYLTVRMSFNPEVLMTIESLQHLSCENYELPKQEISSYLDGGTSQWYKACYKHSKCVVKYENSG